MGITIIMITIMMITVTIAMTMTITIRIMTIVLGRCGLVAGALGGHLASYEVWYLSSKQKRELA